MKTLASILFILIIILIIGCPEPYVRPEPQIPTDTDQCRAGCDYLKTLPGRDGIKGCEESRDLYMPDGSIITCETFCRETQESGRSICPSKWNLAKKCDDIETLRLTCGN